MACLFCNLMYFKVKQGDVMENNARKEFDPDLEDFSSRVNKFIQLEHAWKKVNAKKRSVLCTLEVLILHVS